MARTIMIERIVFFLILVAGIFCAGMYVGQSGCERAQAEAEVNRIKADAKLVHELRAEDNKREVIYRDRVKTVHVAVESCLLQPIAGPVLDQLRDATGATARPAPH